MLKKLSLILFLTFFTLMSSQAVGLEAVHGKVPDGYNFWLYTPADAVGPYKDGKPLIVFLHGASLCGNDLSKVKRYGTINAIEKGRKLDAFVVAPQNPGGSWKPSKVMNVVDYVCSHYHIDPTRIYVMGMSLGGYGALDFAATYPERVAAAIGICGGSTVKDLSGLARMPLWVIHGTGDSAVSVGESDKVVAAVKAAQKGGPNRLSYDRVPGMNHSQPARIFYNQETYDWLLSHSLDTPGRPATPTPKVNDSYLKGSYDGLNHSRGSYKSSASKSSSKARNSKSKSVKKKKRK